MRSVPSKSRFYALLLGLAVAACGGEQDESSPPLDATPAGCQPGELELAGGCKPAGISTCADGYYSDELGGCVPILPQQLCGLGTMALPGETVCREVAPCADGNWGDIPTVAGSQHVDAAYAASDSDGSAARPWRTVTEAVEAAAPGAIVAIAAGSYVEELVIDHKPVVLWGRCPGLVEIRGTATAVAPIYIRRGAEGTEVRDLALTGPTAAVLSSGSLDVLLDRLWLHHTGVRGISVEDTLAPSALLLTRSLVESVTGIGAFALSSSLTVEQSVVRGTTPGGEHPAGIGALDGATLTVRSSLIELNAGDGIYVFSSDAVIDKTVVRDSQPDAGKFGGGISIQRDSSGLLPSSATVSDVLVERNQSYGILVDSSTASFERVVVRDTYPQQIDQSVGSGITVQNLASVVQPSDVTIREAVLERNRYAGISLGGSTFWLESVIVRDTVAPPAHVEYGRGVVVFYDPETQLGATGTVIGSVIERNIEVGIFGQGVDLTIERTAVRKTRPRSVDSIGGRGISLQSEDAEHPSRLTVRDCLFSDNYNAAAFVAGTDATFERTTFRETAADVGSGLFGDALVVISYEGFAPGRVTLLDSQLEASIRAAIASFGAEVAIGGSEFECNAIDMNGQAFFGVSYAFDDLSGNRCGCADAEHTCQVLTTDLKAPQPLAP